MAFYEVRAGVSVEFLWSHSYHLGSTESHVIRVEGSTDEGALRQVYESLPEEMKEAWRKVVEE